MGGGLQSIQSMSLGVQGQKERGEVERRNAKLLVPLESHEECAIMGTVNGTGLGGSKTQHRLPRVCNLMIRRVLTHTRLNKAGGVLKEGLWHQLVLVCMSRSICSNSGAWRNDCCSYLEYGVHLGTIRSCVNLVKCW